MKTKMNVSVNYNEGLFYVDYKDISMFHEIANPANVISENKIPQGQENLYEYDATMTQTRYEAVRNKLAKSLTAHFPSLKQPTKDTYLDKGMKKRVIAANKLFNVVIEDNIWSLAVELTCIPKGDSGLQTQMFPNFLKGLRAALFEQFDVIYVRNGSWGATPITVDMPEDYGNKFIHPDVGYTIPGYEPEKAYKYATK